MDIGWQKELQDHSQRANINVAILEKEKHTTFLFIYCFNA